MWPPTPTPLPPGEPFFAMPDSIGIWGGVDSWIQFWGWLGAGAMVLQVLILLTILLALVFMLFRYFQKFIERDAGE